jgi:2,4-dienoyl-CoA reductase-like NADH-dependent reductase (Old Yellow Enzyme family)
LPPEEASVGLRRFETIEKHIKEKFEGLTVVGSGLSYYRDDLIEQSERQLKEGVCDLVGYGRMWLAYPEFFKDYMSGSFDAKKCCLACSKCTVLMRNKQVSGCAVFNKYYRDLLRSIQK